MSETREFLGVVGYFTSEEALREAVHAARGAHFEGKAYLPLGDHTVIDALQPAASNVRYVAGTGAVLGILTALAMTIWMSWDYPLIVGGKPITSYPPFLVVAFELMILFGSIFAIGGFLWLGRLPYLTPSDGYSPDVAVDRMALFLRCSQTGEERARADALLRNAGAVEVRPVHAMGYTPLQPVGEESNGEEAR